MGGKPFGIKGPDKSLGKEKQNSAKMLGHSPKASKKIRLGGESSALLTVDITRLEVHRLLSD